MDNYIVLNGTVYVDIIESLRVYPLLSPNLRPLHTTVHGNDCLRITGLHQSTGLNTLLRNHLPKSENHPYHSNLCV